MQREKMKDGTTVLRGGNLANDFPAKQAAVWPVDFFYAETVFTPRGIPITFPSRGPDDRFLITYTANIAVTSAAPLHMYSSLAIDGAQYGPASLSSVNASWFDIHTRTQIVEGLAAGNHDVQLALWLYSAGTGYCLGGPITSLLVQRMN